MTFVVKDENGNIVQVFTTQAEADTFADLRPDLTAVQGAITTETGLVVDDIKPGQYIGEGTEVMQEKAVSQEDAIQAHADEIRRIYLVCRC